MYNYYRPFCGRFHFVTWIKQMVQWLLNLLDAWGYMMICMFYKISACTSFQGLSSNLEHIPLGGKNERV